MNGLWVRTCLAVMLAVVGLAAASPSAFADQTVRFNIQGAGRVTAVGVDCIRAVGGGTTGDCETVVGDGPIGECDFGIPCPTPPRLGFTAHDRDGFAFTQWDHPQCNPRARNPCEVQLLLGQGNPVLTVTASFRDFTQPTVQVTSPAGGAVVSGTIPLNVTAADNVGVARVDYLVRGTAVASVVAPFATTFNTRTLADGPAGISAMATDVSGFPADSQTVNVTIDNTRPTLTVTGPNDQTFGPGATLTWPIASADATTGPPILRCSVVPVGQAPAFNACTTATTHRVTNPSDGRYTLTVRSSDRANNAIEQTRTFAVDSGPPETSITTGPADGERTDATDLGWSFEASEPGSTFECRVFAAALTPVPFGACSAAAAHVAAGFIPGTYAFEVRATDVIGNVDPTPARRTVTVNAPPIVGGPGTPSDPGSGPLNPDVAPEVLSATLTFSFRDSKVRTTRLTSLTVRSFPAGSTITARCPKGCTKKTLVKRNASGSVSLKAIAKKPLKVKTRIVITISKPGAVSVVKVVEIRARRAPKLTSLCQAPGQAKPGSCA